MRVNGKHMPSTRKKIPTFSSEDEEREFWSHADSTEYIDWSKAKELPLSRLKPTLRTISISLPEFVVAELTRLAKKRDVSYESLLQTYLVDRIQAELAAEKSSLGLR
jgi:predicted AAA+ superfamily ATPase